MDNPQVEAGQLWRLPGDNNIYKVIFVNGTDAWISASETKQRLVPCTDLVDEGTHIETEAVSNILEIQATAEGVLIGKAGALKDRALTNKQVTALVAWLIFVGEVDKARLNIILTLLEEQNSDG